MEELKWRYIELTQSRKRTMGAAVFVGAVLIGVISLEIPKVDSRPRLAGAVWLLLFALWLVGCASWAAIKSRSRRVDLESYRQALRNQRDFLMYALLGIVIFLLPGCVCFLWGTHVYEFVLVVYLLAFAEAIRRGISDFATELRSVSVQSA